ncbi:MAG: hypothetical protein IID44_24125 [Planctomycetes bacterium]|nr:hypothetical protein [Planctomycetota bacterium]MCH9003630.1 hypothetical protein [Planctomycetota bacterium]
MKFKPTPLSVFRRHNTLTRAAAACLSLAIVLPIGTTAQAQAAEFHPLGFGLISDSLGGNFVDISEDGSVVVGTSLENRLIRWTRETGPKLLDPELDPLNPIPLVVFQSSMSGDASTVITTFRSRPFGFGTVEAIKISDGVIEVLPVGPDVESSFARLISQDGSTVVGHIIRTGGTSAGVRWTDDGISEFPSEAFVAVGISASGDVIVDPGENHPIRWSEETGAQRVTLAAVEASHGSLGSTERWPAGLSA